MASAVESGTAPRDPYTIAGGAEQLGGFGPAPAGARRTVARTGRRRVCANWLVGQRYDLFFFIGSCLLTVLFLGIYHGLRHLGFAPHAGSVLITYFLFTTVFDHPHIFQTFSRTHVDRENFARYRIAHTWGLAAFIAAGFALSAVGWDPYVIVFGALFGSWHIIRQHWGILRAYKAVNNDRDKLDHWIDTATFYLGAFAFYLYDYTGNPRQTIIYGKASAPFPNVPPLIAQVVWYGFLFSLGCFALRQIWLLMNGRPIILPKILLMAAALGTRGLVLYFTATPFLVAEALETTYHDVQYQGWMMNFQRKRFPDKRGMVRRWLLMALAYGLIVGVIEIVGLMNPRWSWLFVPFWMIVLWHYWVEGRIWRMRKQPELRAVLARG